MKSLRCDECGTGLTEDDALGCGVEGCDDTVLCGETICVDTHRDAHGQGKQYAVDVRGY